MCRIEIKHKLKGSEAEFIKETECRYGQSTQETLKGKSESPCLGPGVFIEVGGLVHLSSQ